MNETPKQRFNKTAHAKTWNEFVDSPQFKAAADAALLQHGVYLGNPTETNLALANEFKRQGARDFLNTLINLAILEEPAKAAKPRTVDHKV